MGNIRNRSRNMYSIFLNLIKVYIVTILSFRNAQRVSSYKSCILMLIFRQTKIHLLRNSISLSLQSGKYKLPSCAYSLLSANNKRLKIFTRHRIVFICIKSS